MPNALLQKMSDEQNIALAVLEDYWNKAKALAKKNKDVKGATYWAYVMGIFKNMTKNIGSSCSTSMEQSADSITLRLEAGKFRKTIIYVRRKHG